MQEAGRLRRDLTAFRPYRPPQESTAARVAKWAIVAAVAVMAPLFAISSYRAYVQIKSLELTVPDSVVHEGTRLRADVVSWGRTFVQLRIELIQGTRVETLAIREVDPNRDRVFDPRSRRANLVAVLTEERLAPFDTGQALVRTTARGSMQWLREPPPQVREAPVVIRRAQE